MRNIIITLGIILAIQRFIQHFHLVFMIPIPLGFWMSPLDFTFDQLNTPNARATQLNFPDRSAGQQFLLCNVRLQRWRVSKTP